jgi:hypothetical protein
MRLNREIERRRAKDDPAIGLIADVMKTHGSDFVEEIYQRVWRRSLDQRNGEAQAVVHNTLAIIGFWTVIESIEREAREAREANP